MKIKLLIYFNPEKERDKLLDLIGLMTYHKLTYSFEFMSKTKKHRLVIPLSKSTINIKDILKKEIKHKEKTNENTKRKRNII